MQLQHCKTTKSGAGPRDPLKDIAAAGIAGPWFGRGEAGLLPSSKGAYVLLLRLACTTTVELPRRTSPLELASGWYVYVGSAWGSGGLRARLRRHFKRRKKRHWHIDRLTSKSAEISAVVVSYGNECDLAAKLLKSQRFEIAVAGFGSSDCRNCESHLLTCRRSSAS